jgi:hypothetical protein
VPGSGSLLVPLDAETSLIFIRPGLGMTRKRQKIHIWVTDYGEQKLEVEKFIFLPYI